MSKPTYSTGGSDDGGFAARFPELIIPTPTASQQTWITERLSERYDRLDQSYWTTDRAEAALLLAAHEWILRRRRELGGIEGSGGGMTQESVGDWSRTYTATPGVKLDGTDSIYASTDAGLAYVQLRNSRRLFARRVSL